MVTHDPAALVLLPQIPGDAYADSTSVVHQPKGLLGIVLFARQM